MGSYCDGCGEKINGNNEGSYNETGQCNACNQIDSDNELLEVILDNIDSALTEIDSDCPITAHKILTTTYYKIEKYLKE